MSTFKSIDALPDYDKGELEYLADSYAQVVDALYRFAENNGLNSDEVFNFANQLFDKMQSEK